MEISDTNKIKELVQNQYKRNPQRSLSACFRSIRKQRRFDLQGDYPLLATIISAVHELGIRPSKKQVTYAFNQSEELKTLLKGMKSALLEQLMKPLSVGVKKENNSHKPTKNEKGNKIAFKKGITE